MFCPHWYVKGYGPTLDPSDSCCVECYGELMAPPTSWQEHHVAQGHGEKEKVVTLLPSSFSGRVLGLPAMNHGQGWTVYQREAA